MHRLTRLAAVTSILTLFIAGCGVVEEPASGGNRDQPVQSPTDRSGRGGAGGKPATPARCRAVSRRLVGRSVGAAQSIARAARCPLRVVIREGRRLSVTDDFRPSRINVRVDHGKVTKIVGLY